MINYVLVKELREKNEITLERMAYDLDTSSSTITRIENGVLTNIRISVIMKMSVYFGVPFTDLVSINETDRPHI